MYKSRNRCPSSLPLLAASLSCCCPGSDFDAFEFLVLNGRLYEHLIDLCLASGLRLGNDRRAWVKLALLRDVLAKRGDYPSPFEQLFATEFPSVYRYVQAVNKRDHSRLIRLLQRVESWLVIENVCPRLVGRVPIISLHDAIYGRLRDVATIREAFQETFDELGLHLGVKVEGGDAE